MDSVTMDIAQLVGACANCIASGSATGHVISSDCGAERIGRTKFGCRWIKGRSVNEQKERPTAMKTERSIRNRAVASLVCVCAVCWIGAALHGRLHEPPQPVATEKFATERVATERVASEDRACRFEHADLPSDQTVSLSLVVTSSIIDFCDPSKISMERCWQSEASISSLPREATSPANLALTSLLALFGIKLKRKRRRSRYISRGTVRRSVRRRVKKKRR